MSEIPGLNDMRANYEIVSEEENDYELSITLGAVPQTEQAAKYVSMGWVRLSDNTFLWEKELPDEEPVDDWDITEQ